MPAKSTPLRICFVTGTRAEFGLMVRTLAAIRAHPKLRLRIIATGMHLDRSRGFTLDAIRNDGWTVDGKVPWKSSSTALGTAYATGLAIRGLAGKFRQFR